MGQWKNAKKKHRTNFVQEGEKEEPVGKKGFTR
jgi:hypothetical protein